MLHDPTGQHFGADEAAALCAFLLPHDPSFATEVSLAITQPASYFLRFHDRLADRGVLEPVPTLPWIAFLDGLAARGQLMQVDWREYTANVMSDLDHILPSQLRTPDRWAWVDDNVWDNVPILEFLMAVGAKLVENDFILVDCRCPWFDSDSYALMVIPKDKFSVARGMIKEFGQSDMVPCLQDDMLSVEH